MLAYFEQIRDAHTSEDTFAEDMGEGTAAVAAAQSAAAPGNETPADSAATTANTAEKRQVMSTV